MNLKTTRNIMINTMKDLLAEQIRDLYDAENRIAEALPKMEAAATDADLKEAFRSHREETLEQAARLNKAASILGVSPEGSTCQATKGLIAEAEELISQLSDPTVKDAALIAAAQRVEHYEIASYGAAATFADNLDEDDVHDLLGETLSEEKDADKKLQKIATGGLFGSGVNKEAVQS